MTSQVPDPVPSHFNPLHREGGDSDRRKKKRIRPLFQSTPPRGWRHNTGIWYDFYDGHFNPLHREGGDTAPPARQGQIREISIHSTARVETVCASNLFSDIPISIHSTARVETRIGYNYPIQRGISIHSTARVETFLNHCFFLSSLLFQSTPPRGWRHSVNVRDMERIIFQSTPPRGWRRRKWLQTATPPNISIHSTARVETWILPTAISNL